MDSPWAELLARVALPLVLWLTCAGIALLAERVMRFRLPDRLLVPAGLGPAMTLCLVGHELGLPLPSWVAVLVILAVAGLVAGRRELRRLVRPWVAVAGIGTYVVYVSPLLLTGGYTWAGYNFLNDTSVQFLLTGWLQDGSPVSRFPGSTPAIALRLTTETAYPMGTHTHLAALDWLLGLRPEMSYQPYIAALAAVGGLAAYSLLRSARAPRPYAAVAAVVALGANLTFQYALQGSIKEIGFVATFLATAALSRELLSARRPWPVAVLWGLAAAGTLAAYSGAALPYLGLLGVVALVLVLAQRRLPLRTRALSIGAGAGALVIASLPSMNAIVSFANLINGLYTAGASGEGGGGSPLGQLQAPLPAWQGLGVWLHGEYIFRVPPGIDLTLTHVAALAVAVLAVAGLVLAARRREPALLVAAVPVVGAYLVLAPRTTPYADAKMLALGGPAVLVLAAWALIPLLRGRACPVGVAVAGLLGLAVAASDAMALHDVRLAPTQRMEDLRDIGQRYAGRGPVLSSEFEEFAKYFAHDTDLNSATESVAARFIELRQSESFLGYSYDLDQELPDYVTSFPYIMVRRGPATSRPPAMYRLDYHNRSYAIWRRTASPQVVGHLPLGDAERSSSVPKCRDVRGLLKSTPKGEVVAAQAPEQAVVDLVGDKNGLPNPAAHISAGWGVDPLARDALVQATPGRAWQTLRVHDGRYAVWVRGSFPRPLDVYVNGRRVGDVQGVDTPNGWLQAATVPLPSGPVQVEVRRRGGRPLPGDGAHASIGAVSLTAEQPERLVRVPRAAAARRLCGRAWDWIEVVRW